MLEASEIIQPSLATVPLQISISKAFSPGIIIESSYPRHERGREASCSVMVAINHVGLRWQGGWRRGGEVLVSSQPLS